MPSRTQTRPRPSRVAVCTAGDTARPDLWDLVDQARSGDAEAFGELFRATVGTVYPYVLRRVLGDRDTADELTADVYLSAWRSITGVRRVASSPVAWLRTIAARRVIDYHRARQRRDVIPAGTPDELEHWPAIGPDGKTSRSAEAAGVDRVQAAAVWAYVRQLTADQNRVLLCRFRLGWSIEETAAALGKRPTAVKTLQYRAMRALRERLAGTYLDPRAGAEHAAAA